MTPTVSQGKSEDGTPSTVASWIRAAGISVNSLQLPATGPPPMTLVIQAAGAHAGHAAATLASYRKGTVQQLPVQICGLSGPEAQTVREWLECDPLVSFPASPDDVVCLAETVMVVPAGVLLGTHSVEAAHDALKVSDGCLVVRAPVDGAAGSVEVWRGDSLSIDRKKAEDAARRAGGERWVSGGSLGLYYLGRPRPKPHMRRGAAGTLELVVLAEDGALPEVRGGYLDRIRALETEVNRLRKAQWNDALRRGGTGEAARVARAAARRVVSKLPGVRRGNR